MEKIRQDLASRNVPLGALHLPALSAERNRENQPVAPTYGTAPAPMGVADIGLRNVGGNMAGYVLNTSSAKGTISITNAQSVYVDGDGPDMYGIQLNSVLTNVTLFGNSTYQFWAQNFVSYTSSSGELAFGDNIWNFSNLEGLISPNVFYAHSANGTLYDPVFYYAIGPTFTIHYPFTVTFYLNSTTIADRPALFFNYTLSKGSFTASGSFDYVIFNSSAATPTSAAPAALFQINGEEYDPVGLINDIELAILGNDNGDTTTFFQLAATATIDYWNSTIHRYQAVPSAVNAGTDTGETSDGIASYYTNAAPTVAELGIGPSFLDGLWNTTIGPGLVTSGPGIRTVVSTVTPAEVMIMVNPGGVVKPNQAQWVPSSSTGSTTFYVPNTGTYFVDYLLSEYAPTNLTVGPAGHNNTININGGLTLDTADGIYTPMIAWGNAELATFASSGTGTLLNPYVLYHNEGAKITSEFAQWNDFFFPVFPGLLLIGTTNYVHVTPAPYTIDYPSWMLPQIQQWGLPSTNNLQDQFWNVSNVVVDNAVIQGWLSSFLFSFYPLGDVIFWNSTGNLIAGNTFNDQGSALALYGGRDNTVWGNTFLTGTTSALNPGNLYDGPSNQTGLWESESGDLIYNNFFSVPGPAYTPTFDPLSCQINCTSASYTDAWNVTDESASASRTVLGTTLTGSIIDTSYQGGSYWSNYGTPSNPYGLLPYSDAPTGTLPPGNGLITNGGDYVPLVPFSLYNVTFNETGLPLGTLWGVATSLSNVSSTGTNLTIESPNGTLPFTVVLSSGEPYYSVSPTSFSVSGADVVVNLTFLPLLTYTFDEAGLYLGILGDWQVTLVGNGTGGIPDEVVSTSTSIGFSDLEPGTYSFSTTSTGYYALPSNGTIAVNATFPDTTKIEFTPVPFATFTETGLPGNTPWNVSLLPPTPGAPIVLTSNSSTIVAYIFDFPDLLSLPGGLANFSAASYDYNATPPSGQFTPGPGTVVPIAFTAFPGTIDLTIGPVCSQVEVDGTIIETSACSATLSVAPGVHELEVSAPGFQTYFNNVSVPAGGSVDLVVSLQSVPSTAAGAVNLTIAPVCAQVTLDGVLTQASTCGSVTIPLPAGIHQLEVSASGYLAYYTNMSIPAGQTVDLNVTLERVPSSSTSSAGVGTQGWELIALLVVIIVVLLAIALILYSRRRQPARPLTPAGATPSTPPISEEPSMVATTSGPSASVPPPVLAEWDESSPLENPPGPPGSGSP